jgi:hypothetical protein
MTPMMIHYVRSVTHKLETISRRLLNKCSALRLSPMIFMPTMRAFMAPKFQYGLRQAIARDNQSSWR